MKNVVRLSLTLGMPPLLPLISHKMVQFLLLRGEREREPEVHAPKNKVVMFAMVTNDL